MSRRLIIGTRGSRLALWQAEWAKAALRRRLSEVEVDLKVIRTSGDRDQTTPLGQLGGRGVFTKEIERALLAGEVDVAVHSLKDLPTDLPEGLALGAVSPREDCRDALIARTASSFAALPQGGRVGTGSLRRRALLLHVRPDLRMQDLRGNLDTRLRKLETEGLDAIVLAVAGLARMGWADRITERLPFSVCLPDAGQGAIGIEVRADDSEALRAVSVLNDVDTRCSVTAERALLKALGGGCQVPIGAWGRVEDGRLKLDAVIASVDGKRLIRDGAEGAREGPEEVGQGLAERLLQQGAEEILRGG
ncbi:MAG: hydroxymethylbilane synthase [Candidatus Handelsmanbacteria bacterium RIFCSPLOWO2_12_FULL_64_10]|uniref:Porphobilinogen deaminase n=1 Tax=Handelsmanbacteria sp. (strain RIFCSPLOWO2_12_FULL_64_10) TaxID=1817868 RepID=A0A1F6CMS0_HANXR|nr:MAG: hydroxymethylbilane synthase [Candidatus Handelsmanbacteria bacterium RIFCSPLOWO2_12_FULL_64_10]